MLGEKEFFFGNQRLPLGGKRIRIGKEGKGYRTSGSEDETRRNAN